MAATTLSPARALRPPRRLDLRAVVGLFLMLAATGGSITFWSAAADTRDILVATRPLPAGSRLSSSDLAVARVRVDDDIYQAAVPAAERERLVGRQLAEPVHAQQVLARGQVSTRSPIGPDQLALTIPVSPEAAVGGRVRPGDAVLVLVTLNKGKSDSRTALVLPRVTVYEVGYDDRSIAVGSVASSSASADAGGPAARGTLTSLTLLVNEEQALQLAQARWNGELDVALLPGQP